MVLLLKHRHRAILRRPRQLCQMSSILSMWVQRPTPSSVLADIVHTLIVVRPPLRIRHQHSFWALSCLVVLAPAEVTQGINHVHPCLLILFLKLSLMQLLGLLLQSVVLLRRIIRLLSQPIIQDPTCGWAVVMCSMISVLPVATFNKTRMVRLIPL